ncbi:MAG: hypothetical protein H7338_15835 [Candidatus Sericytochromatia bacterium]|nr:hypothetical protein [Candidatus Sericytochromatia bacterium]
MRLTLIAPFLAGILAVRSCVRCLAIGQIAHVSHDALTRLLSGDSLQSFMRMLVRHFVPKSGGKLVINHTSVAKAGKLIEGVKWRYDSSSSGKLPARNPAVPGWTRTDLAIELLNGSHAKDREPENVGARSRMRHRIQGWLRNDCSLRVYLPDGCFDLAARNGSQKPSIRQFLNV